MEARLSAKEEALQRRLVLSRRCGHCAEKVAAIDVLRQTSCPFCQGSLQTSRGLQQDMESRQRNTRIFGYGLIGLASFLAGWIPLMQSLVHLAGLFVLHILLLRRTLEWLPPSRRILTRMSVKLFGSFIALSGVLVNIALAPFVGLSPFVLLFVGPALTALYIEGSLRIIRRSVAQAAQGKSPSFWEWLLPLSVLLFLVVATTGILFLSTLVVDLLLRWEVPGAGEIALFFEGILP